VSSCTWSHAAETIQATNSLEKMRAHQMAAAHAMAMRLQVEAHALIRTYKRTGYAHQSLSIEAGRLLNASARMMDTYQHGLLMLQKVRSGGQQTVVVQHVNVSRAACGRYAAKCRSWRAFSRASTGRGDFEGYPFRLQPACPWIHEAARDRHVLQGGASAAPDPLTRRSIGPQPAGQRNT